jgi:predicted peroxiredoxin
VSMFFAGDAVYLLKDEVIEALVGIGTGELAASMPALVEAGVDIYASGMSSKSRGVTDDDAASKNVTFAMPSKLVELTFAADRVLTY